MKLKILKLFRNIWIGIFCLLMLFSIIGIFIGAESFWEGWKELIKIFNPFNLINWLLIVICLSPALLANYFIEKTENTNTKQN